MTLAPPSTRSSLSGSPASWVIASATSRVWYAIASTAAACKMRLRRAARYAEVGAARIRIPVWRAEADECGDEVGPAAVRNGRREGAGFASVLDDAESVAHPLDRGPRDEDGSLERVANPLAHDPTLRSTGDRAPSDEPRTRCSSAGRTRSRKCSSPSRPRSTPVRRARLVDLRRHPRRGPTCHRGR